MRSNVRVQHVKMMLEIISSSSSVGKLDECSPLGIEYLGHNVVHEGGHFRRHA